MQTFLNCHQLSLNEYTGLLYSMSQNICRLNNTHTKQKCINAYRLNGLFDKATITSPPLLSTAIYFNSIPFYSVLIDGFKHFKLQSTLKSNVSNSKSISVKCSICRVIFARCKLSYIYHHVKSVVHSIDGMCSWPKLSAHLKNCIYENEFFVDWNAQLRKYTHTHTHNNSTVKTRSTNEIVAKSILK